MTIDDVCRISAEKEKFHPWVDSLDFIVYCPAIFFRHAHIHKNKLNPVFVLLKHAHSSLPIACHQNSIPHHFDQLTHDRSRISVILREKDCLSSLFYGG